MRVSSISTINNNIYFRNNNTSNKLYQTSFKSKSINNHKTPDKILNVLHSSLAALIIALGFTIKPFLQEFQKNNTKIEPVIENFETRESAISYAIDRIVEPLHQETPKEYLVHINDKNNKIMSERLGQEHSVSEIILGKVGLNTLFVPNFSYTILHGHTENNGFTQTFSFQDFKTFVNNDKCSTMYVVNKNKKFCKFEKTDDYKKPSQNDLDKIEANFEFAYESSWTRSKIVLNKQNEVLLDLSDKPNMHRFWDDTAKEFGIKYSTTYGTYSLYGDVYKNDYVYALDDKLEIVDAPNVRIF